MTRTFSDDGGFAPRGPLDDEAASVLDGLELIPVPFLPVHLAGMRESRSTTFETMVQGRPVTTADHVVDAEVPVTVSVLRSSGAREPGSQWAASSSLTVEA